MNNLFKHIFVFLCLLTFTILLNDNNVYAEVFDENFAVVDGQSLYSYAVSWQNRHKALSGNGAD